MKPTVYAKLEGLQERHEEVEALLGDPDTIANQNLFRALNQEYAKLGPVIEAFNTYKEAQDNFESAQEMLKDEDPDMREMAQEEFKEAKAAIAEIEDELQILLLPTDPNDDRNAFLEIRAGAGGDEAGIFAGNLFRMYSKFAEKKGWRVEVMSSNVSEQGGFKEMIAKISGDAVYGTMKFESGGHRVQRVPETESQGRVHTSACTVAVMPEIPEADLPEIKAGDLKIDTFRASGAGGQHVNTTDSAIRITHLPTGTVVECQDERSQHKNKAKAMAVLAARIVQAEEERRAAAVSDTRRNLLGSGDRSDRIRTYNYPQGRVSDHRINLTIYRLNEVLEGDMQSLLDPVLQEHQADQLAALAENN